MMKTVFIGIDVSKLKVDAAILSNAADGKPLRTGHSEFENSNAGFRRMCQWVKRQTHCKDTSAMLFCCETTGGYDHKLCEYLLGKGCFIWRESALKIARSAGFHRGKDDRQDAWMIADYARRYEDRSVCYRSQNEKIRDLKDFINTRASLVEERAKWRNKKTSKSDTDVKQNGRVCNAKLRSCFRRMEKFFTDEIAKIENEIQELIETEPEMLTIYNRLMTFKGIGPVNAENILAYTECFSLFETSREFATYIGIAPYRVRSGTSIDRPAFVKCYSNKRLKAYLTQAARSAIIHNEEMAAYYHRIMLRKQNDRLALNNVKNKIIHILYSMIKNETDYTYGYETKRLAM